MINKVILVGRITKDPEVKYTASNIAVSTFSLAVPRAFADNSGEKNTDFIQCVVWRKQAENLGHYVKKGALLGVEGRIQNRSYEQNGERRYITEVVCDSVQFLDTRAEVDANYNSPEIKEDPLFESSKKLNVSEDDLPF
jgi:single-strand DNA-binding protein